MSKIEKLAAVSMSKLHEIRAGDHTHKLMGAVITELTDITERLGNIERADAARAATAAFVLDAGPIKNGAMLHLEKVTGGTMTGLDAALQAVAGLVEKGR